MPSFRKKTVITAEKYQKGMESCWVAIDGDNRIQFTGDTEQSAEDWLEETEVEGNVKPAVMSREGPIPVTDDHWIVKDGDYYRYPIEDAYMKENYEEVSPS